MDIKQIRELALKATPQDFDTAELLHIDSGDYTECPLCGGEGAVEITADYCNYDGVPIGVQFYGIGPEHVAAEHYYRAMKPATAIELVDKISELQAQLAAHAEVVEAAREVINTSMVVGDTSVVNTKELMSLAAALAKLEAWK